jgi:hypothetical protein
MKLLWSDHVTRIVVRSQRAVALSIHEYTVFRALHKVQRRKNKRLTSRELWDEVYRGVADPPACTAGVVTSVVRKLNGKLERLHLAVRVENHRQWSFYQIVDTAAYQAQRFGSIKRINLAEAKVLWPEAAEQQ